MRHLYGAIMFFVSMLAGLALPAQAEPGHGAFSVGYAQVHPGGVPALSGTGARTDDLKGINVKYRYEFTDHLGGYRLAELCFCEKESHHDDRG